jgi:hypothetical protein
MAADTKQKITDLGMGAKPGRASRFLPAESETVSGTRGHVCPDATSSAERRAELLHGPRDTLPAPPSGPQAATESGARRRYELKPGRKDTSPGVAPPHSVPSVATPVTPRVSPVTPPPSGRYSSQPVHVDDVGLTKIVARRSGATVVKPRVIDRVRLLKTPLAMREVFLLSLVDGTLTMRELADATGMPEPEIVTILARFVRLGFVTLSD